MHKTPPLNTQFAPRVYLAGKVGQCNYRSHLGIKGRAMSQANVLHYHNRHPFVYSGPLIPSCDHGCWHYFFEGMPGYDCGFLTDGEEHIAIEDNSYAAIVGSTISQIQSSDLLFAWFDSYDAYGTIAEIGIAVGNNIPVYIGFQETVFPKEEGEPPMDWDTAKEHLVGRELWYVAELAHQTCISSDPASAFTRALRSFALGKNIPSWKHFLESAPAIVYPYRKA